MSQTKNESEMLVAPRISQGLCLPWSAIVCLGCSWLGYCCLGLIWSALVCLGLQCRRYIDLLGLPWAVSDHHRMALNARTYKWAGLGLGWESLNAGLLRALLCISFQCCIIYREV